MADNPGVEMWTIVDVNDVPEKNGPGKDCAFKNIKLLNARDRNFFCVSLQPQSNIDH